jgi:hypothetical protein
MIVAFFFFGFFSGISHFRGWGRSPMVPSAGRAVNKGLARPNVGGLQPRHVHRYQQIPMSVTTAVR